MINKSAPHIAELFEQLSELALSHPDTEMVFTYGHHFFHRELKGRNFLTIKELPDKLEVGLRLPVRPLADKFKKLPFVSEHKFMGDGWLNANLETPEQLDSLTDWIKTAYELSKPIRTPDDLMEGESSELLDFLAQIRQKVAHYTNNNFLEDFPHGTRAFRAKKAKGVGQIFVYASEHPDYLGVNVRLPFGEHEHALTLPFVEIPKYIGHKGWVYAKVSDQEELDQVLEWVGLSYELNQPARKKL